MDRNEEYIQTILEELKEVWCAHPQMRLAQLILNLTDTNPAFYYLEDKDFINALSSYYDAGAH